MNKIIDLLGKTVKFVHTENGQFSGVGEFRSIPKRPIKKPPI